MNNLLRTLTESQLKSSLPESDLKLLLSTVKDGRRQAEGKLSDPFYESLDGLLIDLRTVTMDNHDVEAFLKPVLKSDYPDYYEIVKHPMDLQTMGKKVKNKVYKSKDDFEQDLDLIWDNCYLYNAGENHPLRHCVERLKVKAQKLLRNITDRRERAEPVISFLPPSLVSRTNSTSNSRYTTSSIPPRPRPVATAKSSSFTLVLKPPIAPGRSYTKPRIDVPFSESSAITRTVSGMTLFSGLERDVEQDEAGPSSGVRQSLTSVISGVIEDDQGDQMELTTGDKRKPNGTSESRPRKRARISVDPNAEIVDLWWSAVQTDELIGNGLPGIPGGITSHHTPIPYSRPSASERKKRAPTADNTDPTTRKRKKRRPKPPLPKKHGAAASPTSLLSMMNNNIRTMKRVRRTHARFAALNDGDDAVAGPPPEEPDADDGDGREEPWIGGGTGIDMGEEMAARSLNWMGEKVLEHTGFQGASKGAMDVLTTVAVEYLLNVGRTMRYMCDKYSNKMTAEEIILHTLFESGTAKVQDLERYVKDDVVRYGSRLTDLDKKMTTAYREAATSETAVGGEEIFDEEEEDKDGAFVMGDFTDAFGEDFLGLRALGIADEHNLSSLSVPKRLLKPKKKEANMASEENKPLQPQLAFPLPPPFIPLVSTKVDDQIGLLKSFYQNKVSALQSASAPAPTASVPTTNGVLTPTNGLAPPPSVPPPPPPSSGPVVLNDDVPLPARMKMGPVGVILKVGSSSGAKKKAIKKKPEEAVAPKPKAASVKPEAAAALPSVPPPPVTQPQPPPIAAAPPKTEPLVHSLPGTPAARHAWMIPTAPVVAEPKAKKKYVKKKVVKPPEGAA